MKFAFLLALVFHAFSMEKKYDEDGLLQLRKELQQQAESLRKRERILELGEAKLRARENKFREMIEKRQEQELKQRLEEAIQKQRRNVEAAEKIIYKGLKSSHQEKEQESLQKREEIVKAAEACLYARERKFWQDQEEIKERLQEFRKLEQDLLRLEEQLEAKEAWILKEQQSIHLHKQLDRVSSSLQEQREFTREKVDVNRPEHERTKKVKFTGPCNLYPNDSSIKIFRDMKTSEISWEDPKDLIPDDVKQRIESSLQATSNELFECIVRWNPEYIPAEAVTFLKALMVTMAEDMSADKKGYYNFNGTSLMFAAYFDADEALTKLIERGWETEAVNKNERTALHYAAMRGNELSCRILLQNRANINARDENGKTPLMLAASRGRANVVELLLRSGAKTQIKDYFGKTAIQLAENCHECFEAHEKLKNCLI